MLVLSPNPTQRPLAKLRGVFSHMYESGVYLANHDALAALSSSECCACTDFGPDKREKTGQTA
jgi:hypothetical protein